MRRRFSIARRDEIGRDINHADGMGIFREQADKHFHGPTACIYKQCDRKHEDGYHEVAMRVGFEYQKREPSKAEVKQFYKNFT